VTRESLGAWLIKVAPDAFPVEEHVRDGFRGVTTRCVRPSYRADLIERGQPVLLWVSGNESRVPAGIYAQGRTTGRVDTELVMPVALAPLEPPILRAEIVAHPVLSSIEVVRMAAGSNPSFLSREHLDELRRRWPQVESD
jgi:hypothetical protein